MGGAGRRALGHDLRHEPARFRRGSGHQAGYKPQRDGRRSQPGRRWSRGGGSSPTSRRGRVVGAPSAGGCRLAGLSARSVEYPAHRRRLASANCARWLRQEGAEGAVLLVGREPDPPYNRPECSKGYLRGEESREETYFRPNDFWEEQRIELSTRASVTALDAQARTATLSSKEEIEFGKALIATGGNVRRAECRTDASSSGSTTCGTLGNSDAIHAGAEDAHEVVLIGGRSSPARSLRRSRRWASPAR